MPEFEFEVGHDREDVGVAGALAVAVRGALHMCRARLDCGDRVGHSAAGVVLAVDADTDTAALPDVIDHAHDAAGQHAAVGVAQHPDAAPRPQRRPPAGAPRSRGRGRSRRRSARSPRTPAGPQPTRNATVSDTMARFSSLRGAQGLVDVADVGLGHQGDRPAPRTPAAPAPACPRGRPPPHAGSRRRRPVGRCAASGPSEPERRTRCPWASLRASHPR